MIEHGVEVVELMVEVDEFTDPICSWAWGTEPKLRLLGWRHGHRMQWRTVMGGLVGDASAGKPGWDAERAAAPMQAYWRQSSAYTGQPFPMPMRRMARSTDPAGRAVKAALLQGPDVAARVLRRFRESIFVFGATPETPEQFASAASGVRGLDIDRWLADLADPSSESSYRADWEETRRPNDHVRFLTGDQVGIGSLKHSEGHDRYAFPTLVFRAAPIAGSAGGTNPTGRAGGTSPASAAGDDRSAAEFTVPGWMPYTAYEAALEAAVPGSTDDPRPDPTVAEAFAEWGVLTARELTFLCGSAGDRTDALTRGPVASAPSATLLAALPVDVVAYPWGEGLVYFRADEAAARGLATLRPSDAQPFADLVAAFELAYGLVAHVRPDQWTLPTPCAEWDVRALVNHIVGGARMVAHGLTGREIGPEFYGNQLGPDPVASCRAAMDEVVEIFRADPLLLSRPITLPWGESTGAGLAIMFAADHLVHAWDAARSLGRPTDFDHGLVARCRAFGDDYVATHRGPQMFDAAAPAPADANPMDRLAAFVGRTV